jgi:ABC-2 type transport system permease protein
MNWRTIPPLLKKDLMLFFRNRFYAFITIMALVAYIGVYFAMPDNVDEVLEIGMYAPGSSAALVEMLDEDGVFFQTYASEADLQQAVLDRTIVSGIAFPADMMQAVMAGNKPTVNIYLLSDVDGDLRSSMQLLVEATSLFLTGQGLNVSANEIVLGPDMAGAQIPLRDRMVPLFAIVILVFETMGLASLLAEEIQAGTIRALLVTSMSSLEFFIAKGIISVVLVMFQALVLTGVVGALAVEPLIIITTLLLGALLVTGIGFLMGALGKDMLSVMAWGILALIILAVPAFGVVFPGTMTGWAKVIPSYYLVDTVNQVYNYGAGWAQINTNLLILLAWDVVLLTVGALVLKRKFA